MSTEPTLLRRNAQHYAGIPIEVTLTEWHKANALVPEIYEWLARNGIEPGGGPIYRYRVIGDNDREFDLVVGGGPAPCPPQGGGGGYIAAFRSPAPSRATAASAPEPCRPSNPTRSSGRPSSPT